MNYDKNSFLSGVAVGRQLKGWASGGGGSGVRVFVATGGKDEINIQGTDEHNYLQADAGTMYVGIMLPSGAMYVVAASRTPFETKWWANNDVEASEPSWQASWGGETIHVQAGRWYAPPPTPTIPVLQPIYYATQQSPDDYPAMISQGVAYIFGVPTRRGKEHPQTHKDLP